MSLSGGTLSGPLTLAANPSAPLQAVTKQYVDGQVSATVPLSGGTLVGATSFSGESKRTTPAATKQYVDGQISAAVPVSGGTLSGALTLAADPVSPLQPTTKRYVDALGVSFAGSGAVGDGITDDTTAPTPSSPDSPRANGFRYRRAGFICSIAVI